MSSTAESPDNSGFERSEFIRYSRHFSLPEVGIAGQRRLKEASVLLIGAGGLGAPVSMYLTAAGIGHLGIVDFDVIDLSNLQRQILYSSDEIKKHKLAAARERLHGLNPHVQISTYEEPLSADNAMAMFADYDIVIDGTDNFPTRYLVNDVCVFQQKPNVYGSIYRFEGQVSVFDARSGPCYRCLYAEPPPPGLVPSCAEGGVLGVLPGIVGSLQATEAIKWIVGAGDLLVGRLMLFDALAMQFREVRLKKDPDCVVCGPNPTVTAPIDYEGFCGVSSTQESVGVPEIAVEAVSAKLGGADFVLVDVREPWEWEISRIESAVLMPQNAVSERLDELDPAKEIVILCRTGQRSARVTELLIQRGYPKVKNMTGGINAWAAKIDPSLSAD